MKWSYINMVNNVTSSLNQFLVKRPKSYFPVKVILVQYHCWKPMFCFWLISVTHSMLFLGACVHLILSILNAGVTHTNGTTEAGVINSFETQCLPVFHMSRTISSCCKIFQLLYLVYIA